MRLVGGLKSFSYTRIADTVLKYLSDASDEHIIRFLKFARRIPKNPDNDIITGIDYIIRVFEQSHPALEVVKKLIAETHPNVRRKTLENWIINSFLLGTNKREEYRRKYGCHSPVFFVISPTMRCNLKCYGCYAGEYSQTGIGLSFDLIDRIITEGKEMGIHFIVVSGGEPFLRKDLLQIYAKHSDVGFQVYTNGSLLDEKTVRRLAELGNVMPCISVEGYEKETDERRGKGHFRNIMAAMDGLKEAGVVFGFSATATRYNADVIVDDKFVDTMIEKGATLGWYFSYVPIGRKPDISLMPTPAQRDHQRRRVSELRNSRPILLADFWNDGWMTNGCISGGERYFHINANGDVEPCVFAHFAVDNIKDKSLSEAINSPLFRKIRDMRPYCLNPYRPCMLIDVPQVSRTAFCMPGVYPTHPGAETLFTDLAADMDRYAAQYGELADKAWAQHPLRPVYKREVEPPKRRVRRIGKVRIAASGD
jgi:MoaA/NifB/PqqE/SkfB family radical SAM enzyme